MSNITPLKAIKQYCLSCGNGQPIEVKECPIRDCALYQFRFGKNPNRKREMSDEERELLAERLRNNRNGSVKN